MPCHANNNSLQSLRRALPPHRIFLTLPALLSFALSHRRPLNCSHRLLTQHQEWESQFRIIHDRAPLFIPTLLQRGLADPQGELWHVRRFESWGTRSDWSEWNTIDVNRWDGDLEQGEPVEWDDHTGLDSSYFDEEYQVAMQEAMQKHLYLSGENTDVWMERIREGRGKALKGLMIALAPNINTVIFIAHPFDGNPPLTFLARAVSRIAASSLTPVWPPGFQSLTSMSIADYTSLQHPHDIFYCSVADIVPFFSLPNLKELSLQVVGYTDDEEDWDLPVASSSIEKLKMDCCDISDEVIGKLVLACRALKSIEVDSVSWTTELEKLIAQLPVKDSLERVQGVPIKEWLANNADRPPPWAQRILYFSEDVMLRVDNGEGREDAFELEVIPRPGFPPPQNASP